MYIMKNKRENMNKVINEINKMTDKNELESLIGIIQTKIRDLTVGELTVGCKVWVVQKTKRTAGTVTKINIKKAVVEMNWQGRGLSKVNVPLTMLEVA